MLILVVSRHTLQKSHMQSLKRIYGSYRLSYYHGDVTARKVMAYMKNVKPDAVVFYCPLSVLYRVFLAMRQERYKCDLLISVDKKVPESEAEWLVKRRDGSVVGYRHDHFLKITEFSIRGLNPLTGMEETFIPEF